MDLNCNLLPDEKEIMLIKELNSLNVTNEKKAKLLSFYSSLILAKCGISKLELNTYMLNDYLFNRLAGNISEQNAIEQIDLFYQKIRHIANNSLNNSTSDTRLNDSINDLLQYVNNSDMAKFQLAFNYINNLKNRISEDFDLDKKDVIALLTINISLKKAKNKSLVKKNKPIVTQVSNR